MQAFWSTIISAVILGPLVVIIQGLRKENSSQHAESRELLQEVSAKVDKVDSKIDRHVEWHLNKE
jgi:hypothetical protein